MTSTPSNPTPPDPSIAVVAQLSAGPTFHEVAASLLREQLQERYPALNIDPDKAAEPAIEPLVAVENQGEFPGLTAADVMSPSPKVIAPDARMSDVVDLLTANKIANLFVVEDGKPTAIVHIAELMQAGYVA